MKKLFYVLVILFLVFWCYLPSNIDIEGSPWRLENIRVNYVTCCDLSRMQKIINAASLNEKLVIEVEPGTYPSLKEPISFNTNRDILIHGNGAVLDTDN